MAARIVLIDAAERVLMFRGIDPARPDRPYWFTPGGGLEPGEPPAVGAARELAEETGLTLDPEELGEPVHEEIAHFSFNGIEYRQEQVFYLFRVAEWKVDRSGFDVYEVDTIDRDHWWSLAELERTDEVYYPTDLVPLLKGWGIGKC